MQPGQKKRAFLYAGIGFVAVGIASIVMIYICASQAKVNRSSTVRK
jgi:hypothetical protein